MRSRVFRGGNIVTLQVKSLRRFASENEIVTKLLRSWINHDIVVVSVTEIDEFLPLDGPTDDLLIP